MSSKKETVRIVKKQIGARIREIREGRGETQPDVASRAGTDKGLLSNLEQGKANPTLDVFLPVITDGLCMEWAEFCSYWAGEEAERRSEERNARQLLEKLLRQGSVTRRDVIALLHGVETETEQKRGDKFE